MQAMVAGQWLQMAVFNPTHVAHLPDYQLYFLSLACVILGLLTDVSNQVTHLASIF